MCVLLPLLGKEKGRRNLFPAAFLGVLVAHTGQSSQLLLTPTAERVNFLQQFTLVSMHCSKDRG